MDEVLNNPLPNAPRKISFSVLRIPFFLEPKRFMEEEMLVHFEELVHFNIFLLMLVFIAIIALNVRLTQSPHVWAWLGIGMPRGTTCAAVIRARNDAAHPNWQSDAAAQETARQALASGAQAILADITKLRAFSWGAFALIMCSMAVLVDVMVETEMFAFLFFLAFGLFILIAGIIYAMVRARARSRSAVPPSLGRYGLSYVAITAPPSLSPPLSLWFSQVIQRYTKLSERDWALYDPLQTDSRPEREGLQPSCRRTTTTVPLTLLGHSPLQ